MPRLLQLPACVLERIVQMAAVSTEEEDAIAQEEDEDASAVPASAHLGGLYCSCRAARCAISTLITSAVIALDERQEIHGQTCGFPLLARMRKLTIILPEHGLTPWALQRLMSNARVQAMLVHVRELEVLSRDGSVSYLPLDVAPIAAACASSLHALSLSLQTAAHLDLAPLELLSALSSLTLQDAEGKLETSALEPLSALVSLTHLDVTLALSSGTPSPYPTLATLRSLAHLSLIIRPFVSSDSEEEGEEEEDGEGNGWGVYRVSQLGQLSALQSLTRLDLSVDFHEGNHVPLAAFLGPIAACTQLAHLELPDHAFHGAEGLNLLLGSLPRLAHLRASSLNLDQPAPLHLNPPPPTFNLLQLDHLTARVPWPNLPPCATHNLCIALGTADTAAAVAAVAEQVGRAVAAVDALDVTLKWDALPAVPPTAVASALAPLGACLKQLMLVSWRVDGPLVHALAAAAPGLDTLSWRGNGASVTSDAWTALPALDKLQRLGAMCPLDLRELSTYAAEAPRLGAVFYSRGQAVVGAFDDEVMEMAVTVQRRSQGYNDVVFECV